MRKVLRPHVGTPCEAVSRIEVDVARPAARTLNLRYFIHGSIGDVQLPAPAVPERSDRLWQHTCLEVFIRSDPGEAYHEFNFAPSLAWASYRLSGYRAGMHPSLEIAPPRIEASASADRYEMEVELDLSPLADLPTGVPWRLGLSAIIEERSGRKSYWALAHPDGEPDFHHPACFALQLPAAERS